MGCYYIARKLEGLLGLLYKKNETIAKQRAIMLASGTATNRQSTNVTRRFAPSGQRLLKASKATLGHRQARIVLTAGLYGIQNAPFRRAAFLDVSIERCGQPRTHARRKAVRKRE